MNTKQILFATEPLISTSAVVGNAGIVAGADGKKILKAGTPVYGNLQARGTAFVKETTGGSPSASNANAVVLHDVDVTDGNANGTIVVFGAINTAALDSAVASLITTEVKAALKGSVFFMA